MRRELLTTILLSAVVSTAATAAQVPGGESAAAAPRGAAQTTRPVVDRALTAQDAVEIALKESPVIRGAEEEVTMAGAQVGIARSGLRPSLSVNGFATGGGMGGLYPTAPGVMPQGLLSTQRGRLADANVTAMYPLFTGGRLRALVRQARAVRGASDADLDAVKLGLVLETKTAYRQVLLAQAVADVYKTLLDTSEERLRIDRVALDAGRIPKYFVLRDEAERANAEQMLINARRDVDITLVGLKTTLGISQDSKIALSDTLDYVPAEVDRTELLALAQKQRPELESARQRVAAAEQGIGVARSEYKPQVSLMAMGDAMSAPGSRPFRGVTAGVVVGLPVLDGGRRSSMVDEAQAQVRRAEQEYERVALEVVKDVETAILSVQAAEKSIKASETALASAEEDYRIAQLRYTEGRGINVEVLDALEAFTRARTNHLQALYEYSVARDQLRRAVGEQ